MSSRGNVAWSGTARGNKQTYRGFEIMVRNRMSLVGIVALGLIIALVAVMLAQNLSWSDGDSVLAEAALSLNGDDDVNGNGDGPWWPSRWGPDDEAGASNLITPGKVKKSAKLIKKGKIYELGRAYEIGMPLFGNRVYSLRIPGSPTGGPFGANMLVFHDEFIVGELGQVGTQFDGLGHVGIQLDGPGNKDEMRYYNGFTETEIGGAEGLLKLGVEKIKPIFTQGFLIDVAGLKGRMLNAGEEISMDDVEDALDMQGMDANDIKPGDAVLFNTGWGSLWMVDNELFNSGAPGIGLEVGEWLIEKEVTVVGADTWPVEVVPNPDPTLGFPVHNELLTKNGILIQENLDLSELAGDKVYKFAYIFVRVPFKGGTGSPGSPIAIK